MRRPENLLFALRIISSAVILLLACMMLVSESNIFPSMTRVALLEQNTRLIDNFGDIEAIRTDIALNAKIGQNERVDLFYGEPSFLAIVLFSCLGCFMLTSRVLQLSGYINRHPDRRMIARLVEFAPYAGGLCLLYIQSFSSIIYGLVIVYFAFVKGRLSLRKWHASVLILVSVGSAFAAFSYDYFIYRASMGGDAHVSFDQRFGVISEFDFVDILIGVKDEAKLPGIGFHNGFIYIIATSGIGGLCYISALLCAAYGLASRLNLAMFVIILMMAIMMQNGGVFSPNKVVLFGLVLLPLACSRTIGLMKSTARSAGAL